MVRDRTTLWLLACGVVGPLLMLGLFIATNVEANGAGGLGEVAGLLQRVSIVIGFAWIALLALRLVREPAATPIDQQPPRGVTA